MNKKGLTLIELITVLVVISIIALITIPIITKTMNKSKEQTNLLEESSITEAAKSYVAKNIGITLFLDTENEKEIITLKVLSDEGYLKGNLKNPKTNKDYDLEKSTIIVTRKQNNYSYTLNLVDQTS